MSTSVDIPIEYFGKVGSFCKILGNIRTYHIDTKLKLRH